MELKEVIRLANYVIISTTSFVIIIRLMIFGAMRAFDIFKSFDR